MKNFDYSLLPGNGLVVMTADEIDGISPMGIADFRDTKVLIYKKTGHYLGFSETRGIRLCKGPISMIDGILRAVEDISVSDKIKDIYLTVDLLDFAFI